MDYNMLKKQETVLYKNDSRRHIFNYPGVYQLLIVACIVADSITLFSLIDLFLKQAVVMSYVITGAVAGVLNIAAVLLAACLHNEEFTLRVKKILSGLIIAVFTLFFTAVFTLRVASMEQMYGSNSTDLGITIQRDTVDQIGYGTTEEEFEPTVGQIILAVILGLEPLGTSILCFYIGYEQSPACKRRYLVKNNNIDLIEAIDHDKVMIEELKADMTFDLEAYDEDQFNNIVAVIIQQGDIAKNVANRKLAEHEGTPEGVTYLIEGDNLKQEQNGDAEVGGSVSITPDNISLSREKSIA